MTNISKALGLLVLACIDHEHVLSSCHGTPLEPIGSKVLPQAFYDDDFQSERTAAQLFKRFVSNGSGDEDVNGDADGHSESHHSVSSRSGRRNARASQSAPARAPSRRRTVACDGADCPRAPPVGGRWRPRRPAPYWELEAAIHREPSSVVAAKESSHY